MVDNDRLHEILGELRAGFKEMEKRIDEDRSASASYRTDIRDEIDKIRTALRVIEDGRLLAIGAGKMAIWLTRGIYALGLVAATWVGWYLKAK